jgi:hypothetical protein
MFARAEFKKREGEKACPISLVNLLVSWNIHFLPQPLTKE